MKPSNHNNKKRTLRVLFFAYRPELNATSRYRVYKLIPHLEKAGIECIVCPPFSSKLYLRLINKPSKAMMVVMMLVSFFNRVIQLRHLARCDVVVIQQELLRFFDPFLEYLVKFSKKKIIFDFDDANFALHQLANSKPSRFYDYSKTAKIIKMSDYVLAGSEYLKDYAMQITDKVAKVPTSVDFERYTLKDFDGEKPVIGWMGTSSTLKYLEPMRAVFSQLREEGKNFSVKIVCNQPFEFNCIETIYKKWKLEDEIADLKSFDIGIMPITDDQYARAKCGFKAIQYMAVGVPAVCSAVGENLIIAKDNNGCLMVENQQQWVDNLSLLIDDSQLRKTLGHQARKMIEAKYNIAKNCSKIIEIIRSI